MDVIVLIGRILFVALFLNSGIAHLSQTDPLAGYAESRKVPAPRPAVLASGVAILVGALMILFGIWGDLGALLIFVFLIATAGLVHAFWRERDAGARQNEMIQFLKDIALAGGALIIFALFAYADHELGLTMTGPLFNLD